MKIGPAPSSPSAHDLADIEEEPTWESWLRGFRAGATSHTRARFTVTKATRLLAYSRSSSRLRRIAVILFTPVPPLLASLVAPLVPLQDPRLGVGRGWQFALHMIITVSFTVFGAMIQARAAIGLSYDEYPTASIAAIAVLTSTQLAVIAVVLGATWRFPVPFTWVLLFVPWMLCLILSHVLVLRWRLRSARVRNRLMLYLPSLGAQVSQIVVYPVYSAVFEAVGEYGQIALIGLFPFLKNALKLTIFRASHHLGDYAREIAVCSVEIAASMYQSMIMQNSPSLVASVLVIAVDVFQGLFDIQRFLDSSCVVPNHKLVPTATALIQDTSRSFPPELLAAHSTKRVGLWRSFKRRVMRTLDTSPAAARPPAGRVNDKPSGNHTSKEVEIVVRSLEMLQSAESILLVEYLEVAVPLANTLYLAVAAQLRSADYNPKLRAFHQDQSALRHALTSIAVYMLLQAATLVVMSLVIRVRYRVSALAILAFALESQAWSMQGKMIAWLPVVLAFSVVHYGVDFTFQFNFSQLHY